MSNVDLRHGDCLAVMRELPDNSVDSVVCDPPYGLAEHKRKDVEKALLVRRAVSVLKFLEDEVGRGAAIRTYDPATQEVRTWRLM